MYHVLYLVCDIEELLIIQRWSENSAVCILMIVLENEKRKLLNVNIFLLFLLINRSTGCLVWLVVSCPRLHVCFNTHHHSLFKVLFFIYAFWGCFWEFIESRSCLLDVLDYINEVFVSTIKSYDRFIYKLICLLCSVWSKSEWNYW